MRLDCWKKANEAKHRAGASRDWLDRGGAEPRDGMQTRGFTLSSCKHMKKENRGRHCRKTRRIW
jgi:hypothetical protein